MGKWNQVLIGLAGQGKQERQKEMDSKVSALVACRLVGSYKNSTVTEICLILYAKAMSSP